MAAVAQAQTTQTVTFSASQIGGAWASGGCATTVEKGTSTSGTSATMTWNDTTGATSSSYVLIQIQANWKFWCSGGGYSIAINGSALGAGGTPTNTNNCACNASPFETSTQNITAATFAWTANGSNTLTFTCTGSSWIGVMDGSSGWSVRIVVTLLNVAPNAPTALHQAGDSGGFPQPVGYVSNPTIYFRATVTDPDAANTVGLQAEILPAGIAFGPNPTGTLVSTAAANFVANGGIAEALLDFNVAGLPSGSYHWRARSIDAAGTSSAWVEFNPAPIHFNTDFLPPTTPGGSLSPHGTQVIFPDVTGPVTFSWGPATDSGPPGPIWYWIEISAQSTFTSTIHTAMLTSPGVDVLMNASEKPYYWRVSAVDAAGNFSTPAGPASFMVSWTVPSETEDRFANCGASTGGGAMLTLSIAALSTLLGFLALRRRAG